MAIINRNLAMATKPFAHMQFTQRYPDKQLSEFMFEILNKPRLHASTTKMLDGYYLLYWRGAFLKKENNNGTIQHQGREFVLVFHNCTPAAIYKETNVKLSFRIVPDWISNCNYCIVSSSFLSAVKLPEFNFLTNRESEEGQ